MGCKVIFQAWKSSVGCAIAFFVAGDKKNEAALEDDAELLYQIQASTWDDAMQKHHQLQGWEPYKPMGDT